MAISNEMNAGSAAPQRSRNARHSMAFFVEALVVLAFLMLAIAVFAQLFAGAQVEGIRATHLSEAVTLATNRAEEFSADPTGVQTSTQEDGLTVTCEVTPTKRDAGTLYEAVITVNDGKADIYTISTSRYVSGGDRS